ncbi:hypothetical protein LQZ18_18340 [Lachnospiraceae bacterium ZAX-1]
MNIKYINSKGIEINLSEFPYILKPDNLFDYGWDFDAVDFVDGGKIKKFKKGLQTKSLELYICASTRAEFNANLRNFFDIVGADIANLSPGKLMLDTEEYILGYIYASEKALSPTGLSTMVNGFSFACESPFWTKDVTYSFYPGSTSPSSDGADYLYDYLFDYTAGNDVEIINSDSVMGSDFLMNIWGAVDTPSISIGANVYIVNTVLYTGEFLQVDSRKKTIVRYKNNGEQVNEFESRDMSSEFFKKIQPGLNVIETNCAFDLTMYQKRSEPLWNF